MINRIFNKNIFSDTWYYLKDWASRTWNWTKQKAITFKKWIIVLIFGGVVLAAGIVLQPEDIPFVMVNGERIEFPYSDDNTEENLIIRTDSEEYSVSNNWDITLYAMVENKSGIGQITNLQFYFPRTNTTVNSIEILKLNVSHDIIVEDFSTTSVKNASTSEITVETIKTGEHKETITGNVWQPIILTEINSQINELWLTKGNLEEKPKMNQKTDKQIQTPILDKGISYFKVVIQLPKERIDQEFYIQAVGNEGGYGLLDPTAKTITAVDNAQLDVDYKKFGSASGLFDGTGDYLTTPAHADFNFGTGDFTIDGWIRPSTVTSDDGVFQVGPVANHVALAIYESKFYMEPGGTLGDTLLVNTWYHFAVVRSGNTLTLYVNGVNKGDIDVTGVSMGDSVTIPWIAQYANTAHPLYGWIDEFRVSKGIARWTSDFASSTSAYSCDPANVGMLIHADGADASTTFTDDSDCAVARRIIIIE